MQRSRFRFDNHYRALVKSGPLTSRSRGATSRLAGEIRVRLDDEIDERAKIVLLDMILPTGKTVRDSTREELRAVGGWAHQVAEQLQPGQTVGDAGISEDELHALFDGG